MMRTGSDGGTLRNDGKVSDTKTRLFAWLPLIGYCVLIFIQSSFPSPGGLPMFPGGDKLLHFGGYGLLGGLFLRAFVVSNRGVSTHRFILYSMLLTALYGVSDEVHQFFVPSRTADVVDALADTLGGICGVFCYNAVHRGGFRLLKPGSPEG